MRIGMLDIPALERWVAALIAGHNVYGIQAKDDHFAFSELCEPGALRLDYDVAILPPKIFFQPPRETLLEFVSSAGFKSVFDRAPFILFGVHPYDMAAINQMDFVFADGNYDEHYMSRRRRAVIVGCDVQTPSANVFAGCMDTAVVKKGFDILLTRVDNNYIVEALTAQGVGLFAKIEGLQKTDEQSIALREKVWESNCRALRRHELKPALKDLPALLERSYDHPVWEEKAQQCFSCGSCNMVCPTCYCFDVRDEVSWELCCGVRCRVWDGCLLRDFATVAGGHNFRKKRSERYRHRFYRKGKYMPDKVGAIACVGCGRCVTACVAKIANPVEVFNRLLEEK